MKSQRSLVSFIISILMLIINYGMFLLLKSFWLFLELGDLSQEVVYSSQLVIIPILILFYITLSINICSIVSIFKKLKPYNEGGLIRGLIVGLIWGTFSGVLSVWICGMIMVMIKGIIFVLIGCLIVFGIAGLIWEIQE